MKKQLTCLLSMLAMVPLAQAQSHKDLKPCATYASMEEVFTHDPAARQRYEAAQAELLQQVDMSQAKGSAFEYTVPVVFHVLHKGGAENVSDAYIQQALAWVNQDYDRTHSDVNTIEQPFQNFFIDSDIKFMLAKKDPNGNCTNGIIHYYDSRTDWDREGQLYYNSPLYAGLTWNPTKYLNVILVRDIKSSNTTGGNVIGYTFKPGTHGSGDTRDAVVFVSSFLNNFENTRYLSHEIGHWLNLSHTFGDTNDPGVACGDDGVCDTPPTRGQLGGCPSSQAGNSCATTATCGYNAGQWNAENIMDYTDCSKNFTAGQTARMRAALASSTSGRSNLWQPANLAATDVDGVGNCAPGSDFTTLTESYTICAGQELSFKEYAYGATPTSYQWAANDAVISSPTSGTTTILFTTAGTSTVTLTVSNGLGSTSKSKIVYVRNGAAQLAAPASESFEQGVLPADWSVYNPNAASGTWKHTWSAALDGGGSYYIEGATLQASQEDHFMSPVIDFQSSPLKQFNFAYAYGRKNASLDIMKVQASIDCGGSWMDLQLRSSNQLANGSGGTSATPFVPTQAQWKVVTQDELSNWDLVKNSPHAIIKWLFLVGQNGNAGNYYLDAVNVPSNVGIAEFKADVGMSIYPNPSSGQFTLSYRLSSESNVSVEVMDLSGRVMQSSSTTSVSAGTHNLLINEDGKLAAGVYMLNLKVNGVKMSEKVIIH